MNKRPNVLFLVHRVPYPPNRGDRIRSFHFLKHLAQRANVYLATLADEPVEPTTRVALGQYCEQIAIEPMGPWRWPRALSSLACGRSATEGLFRSRKLRSTIEKWVHDVPFDSVVVFCSSMAQYLDVPQLQTIPALVDLVDVDSQKFFDYAGARSFWKAWLYRLEAQRLRRLEVRIARRAHAVTLVSEAEADLYRTFCPNEKTLAVPNGVDLEYFQPQSMPPVENRCVFVGVLDYPPNVDAMLWLCHEIWPRVREHLSTATLSIVGRNPTRAIRQLSNVPGVEVVGSVPDVRPYMASASLAVAPLRIARGIQNKVLEALAMGLPVIVSPAALEGLALSPGKHVLRAESADEWVQGVVQLCRDRATSGKLGKAGRKFVESEHSWPACLSPLDEALHLHISSPRTASLAASAP